jgi:SAM-dependent methyltransferase
MREYKKLSDLELQQALSETAKYRHLTAKYCFTSNGEPGCGVDIASQGDAVVPWAISFDLPKGDFDYYCSGEQPKGALHLRGYGDKLPFEDNSLDFVYSSHLLEDYADWDPVLSEWVRVLKVGGSLIVLVPDKELWAEAMKNGQSPNLAHKHESHPGELSTYAERFGLLTVQDRLTKQFVGDYSVLFVAKKVRDVIPKKASDPVGEAIAAGEHLFTRSDKDFVRAVCEMAAASQWGVELGCHMGRSLLSMCLAGSRLHVWGVDTFSTPGILEVCQHVLKKQIGQSQCELIPGDGMKSSKMLQHMTGKLDFVTVTGDWPTSMLELDAQQYVPLLKSGGAMIGYGRPPVALPSQMIGTKMWKHVRAEL